MKTISFSVTESEHAEIKHYAETKGLHTPSALARFALKKEMRRYPLKRAQNDGLARLLKEEAKPFRALPPESLKGRETIGTESF